jgi:hypothetical protein
MRGLWMDVKKSALICILRREAPPSCSFIGKRAPVSESGGFCRRSPDGGFASVE